MNAKGPCTGGPHHGVRLIVTTGAAAAAFGALVACGSSAGENPASSWPFGPIGFVGGVGIGFVGGGRGSHDGGSRASDAGADAASGRDSGERDGGPGGEGEDAGIAHEDAGDGGSSVGVMLNITPGFFQMLFWTIDGPAGSYSGSLSFGAAQSIEFVVGGILAGDGYRLTLRGTDPGGDPCIGTSAPFSVAPGATSGVSVTIECFTGDGGAVPAMVMTGSVAVDAGVVMP